MPVLFIVVWIIVVIVHGIFWGSMAQSAADRKGLGPNWFLCGFFLGPIGYLVAKVQDDRFPKTYTSPEVKARVRYKPSYEQQRNNPQAAIQNNFWTCSCGRVNASYITTCACGKMREEIPLPEKEEKKEKADEGQELKNFALIRELKSLLDDGIITGAEFDAKKKQLLGLDDPVVK